MCEQDVVELVVASFVQRQSRWLSWTRGGWVCCPDQGVVVGSVPISVSQGFQGWFIHASLS